MTEPKKRSDFSIKRLCPESSEALSEMEEMDYNELREYPPETPEPSPIPVRPGSSVSRAGSTGSPSPPQAPTPPTPPVPMEFGMYPLPLGMAANRAFMMAHPAMIPCDLGRIPTMLPHSLPGGGGGGGGGSSGSGGSAGPSSPTDTEAGDDNGFKKPRKNYKNMTRERRVEANARERSRVHTISAAFDSLRRAVPSYSYNQKLSKLAILRIACSYIMALAKLADMDYSMDNSNMSFADCVDVCTRTIQTEGRARRRH